MEFAGCCHQQADTGRNLLLEVSGSGPLLHFRQPSAAAQLAAVRSSAWQTRSAPLSSSSAK